ncbi:Gfo/Idh/MocA family protein [Halobellus sp. Atlit-38R]|uniref:Gfo/Idh/MocA family protein n=1 Tax=Halobellus sp. Atlit-38R TaxID=2282131 RepID=UPI001F23898B|nr:Gfo/Idh/MocA family oxidoreductase [Halobellus sp. Atlit-38R]
MVLNAAVIGTGEDPEQRDRTGYAMAYRHAPGYERRDDVDLVACADIVPENALAFANRFDVPKANVYEDYETMLEELDIDVVSVCTPPSVHADIVVGCAESGTPDAVHCEKPMATTWGDCQRMVEACDRNDVQFTINHQRRFGGPFLKAKALLDRSEIGDLERLEWGEANLLDAGVHLFDLCGFYTDGTPVKWVLANVDYREENLWFGTHNENQGLAQWQYEDGVTGLAITGEADGLGADVVGCYLRLVGSDGVIELGVEDGPDLRYRTGDSAWKTVDTSETIYGPKTGLARAGVQKLFERVPVVDESRLDKPSFHERSIDEVIESLLEGREPSIRGAVSLRATELAFASWESARRQGRVDLPLDIDDNPLEAMVEAGVYDVGVEAE